MMPNDYSKVQHSGLVSQIGQHVLDRLPVYATAIVFSSTAEAQYPAIAHHLRFCVTCRSELEQLVDFLNSAFAEPFEAAEHYPQAQLPFLEHSMSVRQRTHPLWQFAAGQLVVHLPEVLPLPPQQHLAGIARGGGGQLIYRYTQEPGSVNDLEVQIEVYADDLAHMQGRVRVGVDVPSRGPLDQTGSLVTLHAGSSNWQGETDESGCVDFVHIPLAVLPQIRVEITPQRGG